MATSVTTSLPMWLAGCTYDATGGNDLRNSGITALLTDPGYLTGSTIGVLGGVLGGAGMQVTPATGMTVTAQAGSFAVPNTASAIAGGYVSTLAANATLTVQTADPTNPRIDIVCANVVDNGNNTSFGQVQIITGTPAGSPVAPSAPANSITLAQISVPANTVTITSGLITDQRTYTSAVGGVLRAPKGSVPGYHGQLAYDPPSDSFYQNVSSGRTQMRVLPFGPVHVIRTTSYTIPGSAATLLSATITADGNTDLKITWHFGLVSYPSASVITANVLLDSTTLDTTAVTSAAATVGSGVTHIAYTSSAASTTPSAATHTVKLQVSATNSPIINQGNDPTAGVWLRVEPVSL